MAFHRAVGTYRRHVSRFIALSEFSRKKLIEGGLPDQRIVVKPNFVDAPVAPLTERRDSGLYVGRLSPEKGTEVLSAAAKQVPSARIDVMGTGEQQSTLAGNPNLNLLGWKRSEDVLEKMRTARYLILPSICHESFPRALVEAYASGLPVIASRLGAMAELVEDGETGLLFEAGNASDLARKIQWAENNPSEMARMSRAARAMYEAKYTPARNYAMLLETYRQVSAYGRVAKRCRESA
nr:glycosyltransferase family 4 protein [Sulfurifustis variabilis]